MDHKEDIQYLRQRVDGIGETLAKNTAILEQNTDSLREHMRRTELLEKQMDTALLPIRAIKWLASVVIAIGSIYSVIKLLKF